MAYLIGLIIGSLLGLTGAGGSVFAVPLLVLFIDLPAKSAMGIALGAVAFSAFYGVIRQRQNVLWVPGIIIAAGGMFTAPIGKWFANSINDTWLLMGFSILATIIAARMWLQASSTPELSKIVRGDPSEAQIPANMMCRLSETGVFHLGIRCVSGLFFGGLLIGLLSGLFGVGGGFLIVPFLLFLSQLPMQVAVATSLFTIVIISSIGFFSHLSMDKQFDFILLAKVISFGIIGMMLSQKISRVLAGPILQKTFAVLLILISITSILI